MEEKAIQESIQVRYSTEFIKNNLFGDIVMVEVGLDYGTHAKELLDNIPNILKLYLVDMYWGLDTEVMIERFKIAKESVSKYEDKITFCIGDSVNKSKEFANEMFDVVYIDSDHSYEGVMRELIAYYPKCKKGGIFCGHDYGSQKDDEVKKAVNDFFTDRLDKLIIKYPEWIIIK